jgi:hypothetical protein
VSDISEIARQILKGLPLTDGSAPHGGGADRFAAGSAELLVIRVGASVAYAAITVQNDKSD